MRPLSILAAIALLGFALATAMASWLTIPRTLRIAVGPADRDHGQVIAAFARKLQAEKAPVRLVVERKSDFAAIAAAMQAGEVQLAVVRSDVVPPKALAIAVMHQTPLSFVATARSPVRHITQLDGRRVGVLRASSDLQSLLDHALRQAGVEPSHVARVSLTIDTLGPAVDRAEVDAVLLTGPPPGVAAPTARDRAHLPARWRDAKAPPVVFGIDQAQAIALRDPAVQAFEMPPGFLLGTPPMPAEEVSTLAYALLLVGNAGLDDSVVNDLTRLLMTSRTALANEAPSAKSITAADADEGGTRLPLHPGAAAYYDGEQSGFVARYGDLFYIAAMLAGAAVSGLAALWSHLRSKHRHEAGRFIHELHALLPQARMATSFDALETIQKRADELLTLAVERVARGEIDSTQFTNFGTVGALVTRAVERRGRELQQRPIVLAS